MAIIFQEIKEKIIEILETPEPEKTEKIDAFEDFALSNGLDETDETENTLSYILDDLDLPYYQPNPAYRDHRCLFGYEELVRRLQEALKAIHFLETKNQDQFTENPFIGKKIGAIIDVPYIFGSSRYTQSVSRYMIHKKIYLEDKFLFDLDDFSKFAGYTPRTAYLSVLTDLIKNNLLAKTTMPHLYWVNKDRYKATAIRYGELKE